MQEDKAKLYTRGGQIAFHNIRMLIQVNKAIAKIYFWAMLFLSLAMVYLITPTDVLKNTLYYWYAHWLHFFGSDYQVFKIHAGSRWYVLSTDSILSHSYFQRLPTEFFHYCIAAMMISAVVCILFAWVLTRYLTSRGRAQAEKKFIRGAKIATLRETKKAIIKFGASDISISGLPMIKDFELRHTLIHGTTGSGKGQTFNQFLEQIKARGDSAIVFDKGCVFTSLFFNSETDTILNPFDKRCAYWDLWAEATSESDFENIAESLIPMHGDTEPFWVDAARTIFSATAYKLKDDNERSISKLLSLLLTVDLGTLGKIVEGTQAAVLVDEKIMKMAVSIRSVISTYLKSLRFLQGLEKSKSPFCVRDWIKESSDSKSGRFLFISTNGEQHASLRPLVSMWLSIASISLLSLEENPNRRIWFICDELPALHKLPQLGETIAEVRKFGGSFVLGMQSFSQLQKVYGRASAAEMFDLLNTRFFFRSPSMEMAKLVSSEMGEQDVEQTHESYSYGANTIRDGISIGTQYATRALISPSEIMDTPDLAAYVRVPAPVPRVKLEMSYIERPKVAEGFIERDISNSSLSYPDKDSEGGDDENKDIEMADVASVDHEKIQILDSKESPKIDIKANLQEIDEGILSKEDN